MRRLGLALAAIAAFASVALATPQHPKWSVKAAPSPIHPGETATLTITAAIPTGTHIYALNTPEGTTPTAFNLAGPGATLTGAAIEPKPTIHHDETLGELDKDGKPAGVDVGWHLGSVDFTQAVSVSKDAKLGPLPLTLSVKYQACDDTGCLPPKTVEVPVEPLTVEAGAVRSEFSGANVSSATNATSTTDSLGGSLAGLLTTAFVAGLVALLTPCVFPLIPATFAYFTKLASPNAGESPSVVQRRVVQLATLYCVGIVASFIVIGIGVSLTVGATGATRLAANPWVNLGFGILFIVFAFALLEVFELRLPSSVQNLTGAGRKTGGYLGVFVMGLTFVLSAFTCAAPFVGTVMVAAASGGSLVRPILGMATFASALALPFFLLALFPSLLKKLPRSGDWLTTMKGAMGLLELLAALKFLSNADTVLDAKFLPTSAFLALAAIILLATGLWLVGILHIGINTPQGKPTPARGTWAGLFIAAALYCLYGLTGRPLHPLLSGFLPPPDYGLNASKHGDSLDWLGDLETAKADAKGPRRILIDFTGHTCQNCRDVEGRIFPDPAVKKQLQRYTRLRLYTDNGSPEENANLALEEKWAGAGVNPQYVVLDADGNRLASTNYNTAKNAAAMAAWLESNAK